jgi:hypothetical protein
VYITEMVAYEAAHATEETPWRCMKCETLTQHSAEGITPHLIEHGFPVALLKKEHDAIFLHPEPVKKGETEDGFIHEELSQAIAAEETGD